MKKKTKRPAATGLLLIAIFKLVKGVLLVAVGIGALKFLHRDLAATITRWVDILRADPDNRFIHRLVEKAFSVNPKQLKELSAGTFFYASLLLTEGIGLLLRKGWAEYFTVISTAALVPLEVYELVRRFTAIRLGVLGLNIVIVLYLVRRLRNSG
ncbi:MAG TPA: DUF2127 domain-containing protein [Bryobacteraceae bacterium]|nr:DUF2127 domain-containing protein [Bryobacteraceae bacterium]